MEFRCVTLFKKYPLPITATHVPQVWDSHESGLLIPELRFYSIKRRMSIHNPGNYEPYPGGK